MMDEQTYTYEVSFSPVLAFAERLEEMTPEQRRQVLHESILDFMLSMDDWGIDEHYSFEPVQ